MLLKHEEYLVKRLSLLLTNYILADESAPFNRKIEYLIKYNPVYISTLLVCNKKEDLVKFLKEVNEK